MLAKFDTLLVRLLASMAIAVAGTLVFSFLLVKMQQSVRSGPPKTPMSVAVEALETLRDDGWPDTLTKSELKTLELAAYTRSDEPLVVAGGGPFVDMVRDRLNLREDQAVGVVADVDRPDFMAMDQPGKMDRQGPGQGDGFRPLRQPIASAVSVEVSPGDWANITTKRIAFSNGSRPWVGLIALLSLVAVAVWAARNAISPLKQMAQAADVLAADYKHHPVEELGPSDVRQALRTFNRMGRQLEATVSNQRQVLAAIGHDLRTPITSLKLKTEMLADPVERAKLMRAIGELERLTEAALVAASAGHSSEAFQRLDLYSIIDSVVDDLNDLRYDVTFEETEDRPIVSGRASDLMRAVRNIVENAVFYGDRARVRLMVDRGTAHILVDDDGPGIPQDAMESVFQPLVRLEQSRNRETGGHGLGLHIAKTLVEAHHGTIRMRNRPGGGLQVEITLPRDHT